MASAHACYQGLVPPTWTPLPLLSTRPLPPELLSAPGSSPRLVLVSKLEDLELSELSALAVELAGRGKAGQNSTCEDGRRLGCSKSSMLYTKGSPAEEKQIVELARKCTDGTELQQK